ncbi:hypothetical protein GCM10010121_088820 [Streptomyces brasiliensis]|uniref:Uncharacterized protein n=1 Tax=Streptomyces brasiliensis TaxID=1954 RepID=A0A917UL21_9ACTN|nr:hypothetical protein GCM10010121_088820 [Streptomyces brasiliensis]
MRGAERCVGAGAAFGAGLRWTNTVAVPSGAVSAGAGAAVGALAEAAFPEKGVVVCGVSVGLRWTGRAGAGWCEGNGGTVPGAGVDDLRCTAVVASAAPPRSAPDASGIAVPEPLCAERLFPGPGPSAPPAPEPVLASDRAAVPVDRLAGPLGVRCSAVPGPVAAFSADESACRVGEFELPSAAREAPVLPAALAGPAGVPGASGVLCTGVLLL